MNVLLLFPPSWHPSQPYLSLPSLTGFLRQNSIGTVLQKDLNIEILDMLLTKKTCNEFYQRIMDKLRHVNGYGEKSRGGASSKFQKERIDAWTHAVETLPAIMDKLEFAKSTLRSEGFYNLELYMESVFTINEALGIMSALYYPSSLNAVSNDSRHSVYSSREVFKALDDEEENMFLNLYKDHFLSSLLEFSPDLLGISITSTSQ